jgi:hypothetical protein
MNKTLSKTLAVGLMAFGLGWLTQQKAEALGPTTDSIVVSVTPTGLVYGVSISSPYAGGYNFGSVALGATTGSTLAIVVKSSGTVSEYFSMSVVDPGSNPWSPLSVDGTPSVVDQFELQGHFTTANTQPADATFVSAAGNDIIYGVPPLPAGGLFNQGTIGKTAPGTSVYLWLKMKMPASVTSTSTRAMVLSITGQSS